MIKHSTKLEAKEVLPNINHMQAIERVKKCPFDPGAFKIL